jgi:hypothetical protein
LSPVILSAMYSTKLINKNLVENNKYITIGDPYRDPKANMFRQDKKGEKCLTVKVSCPPSGPSDPLTSPHTLLSHRCFHTMLKMEILVN